MVRRIAIIRSGGQTGTDRAALDVAIAMKIPICGWCPKNGWAEDLDIPPGLLNMYPQLKETPSANVEQRTMWNVRDSHATLIILPNILEKLPGTTLTIKTAKRYGRPFMVTNVENENDLIDWFGSLGEELTLNVAGPRESEVHGIYEESKKILQKLLNNLNMPT
jgi:hypothetical protein